MEPENSNFTHTHYSLDPSGIAITSNPEPIQPVGDIDQTVNAPQLSQATDETPSDSVDTTAQ